MTPERIKELRAIEAEAFPAESALTRARPVQCWNEKCPIHPLGHWRSNLCAVNELAAALPAALDAIEHERDRADVWKSRAQGSLDAIERVRSLCDESIAMANRPPWNNITGDGPCDYTKFERVSAGHGSAPYDTRSGLIYPIRPEAVLAALDGKSE